MMRTLRTNIRLKTSEDNELCLSNAQIHQPSGVQPSWFAQEGDQPSWFAQNWEVSQDTELSELKPGKF